MKRKLEIKHNKNHERYELWEVLYDPKDLLYPIHWSYFWDFSKNRETLVRTAKMKFPNLYNKFL